MCEMQTAGGAESLTAGPFRKERVAQFRRAALLKWGLMLGVAGVGLALDQITKRIAEDRMPLGQVYELIPFLALQRTQNSGVSFGMFKGQTWLIVLATVVAVIVVLAFVRMEKRPVMAGVAGGLVLAGTFGNNVFDRLRQGYVTDFIKLPYWPNFNVADIALVAGVGLLIWMLIRSLLAAEAKRDSQSHDSH